MRTLLAGYKTENVQPVLNMLLADAGFDLTVVRTLDKALEKIESEPAYELVILFLCLPDAPGLKAFEELYPKIPQVPIVLISPNHDDRTAFQALAEGAQDFLVEGEFTGDKLHRAMVYACARHAYKQAHREIAAVKEYARNLEEELKKIYNGYIGITATLNALNRTIGTRDETDAAASA